jgi:adenylate cyclase
MAREQEAPAADRADTSEPRRRARRTRRRSSAQVAGSNAILALVLVASNLAAAAVVLVLCWLVIPGAKPTDGSDPIIANVAVLGGFLLVMVLAVILWSITLTRTEWRWLREGRDPTALEQRRVLRAPLRVARFVAAFWLVALVVFSLFNARYGSRQAVAVGVTVLFTGVTMTAVGYLVSERIMRRTAAYALAARQLTSTVLPGVTLRQLLGWASATGSAVLGVVLIGLIELVSPRSEAHQLAVVMVVLGSIALLVGLLAEFLAARAVAVPLRTLRTSFDRVRRGKLDTRVKVYDGTDIGMLQDGFNRMVEGLRERERVRDLFGRHVGEDVARSALEQGELRLGGEVREVCALFVDLIGSTELAASRPPTEVVELLNRFFAVVIDVVEGHGGWVNKFEGDAALVVFGVPVSRPDAQTDALRAGRELARRLAIEVPEVRAGIGVSGGEAVAGNVGAEHRFEYTVIGDPVNEAARLTEVAKGVPGLLAVSGRLVARATAEEAAEWTSHGSEQLRGRSEPTEVMIAASAAAGPSADAAYDAAP